MPEETLSKLTYGEPTFEVQEADPEDDPQDSMEAMANEAEEEEETDVDEPAHSCPKPWFELTALDIDNKPLANAPYKIDLPGVEKEGTLDGQGFLRLEDVEIEEGSYVVNIINEEDESGNATHRVEVVSARKQKEAEIEDSLDPLLDIIVPPWEPY